MKTFPASLGRFFVLGSLSLFAASTVIAADPTALRLEPASDKEAEEKVEQRITWTELMTKGFSFDSSIANFGYLPRALVLEGTSEPTKIKVQYRTKGLWYWANEGPMYEINSLKGKTSEWTDLSVAPEGWVLLPDHAVLMSEHDTPQHPDLEQVVAALAKDYPKLEGEEGVDLGTGFKAQVKEFGEDTLMAQIIYMSNVIEFRFIPEGKEPPAEAQMVINIIPGC